jgi:hypothetical protein
MSFQITEEMIARQPPEAQAIIRALLAQIAELKAELEDLRRQVKGKTPQNSSLPPSSQHPHARPPSGKRKSKRKRGGQSYRVEWQGKTHATFSDAIGAVRRWLWVEWAFVTHGQIDTFTKLPPPLRKLLLNALAQAT